MASSEERIKVLKMIQEGKITVEEGTQLLDALNAPKITEAPMRPIAGGRFLRIRVTDTLSGRAKVNIRLPLSVVHTGTRMGARYTADFHGLDTKELAAAIESGRTGLILDVNEEEKHEHVEMFIEE